MTDKQIICKCNDKECGQCSFEEQLKAKEQECEELKRLIAKQKNAKIQLSKLKDKQYQEFCDIKQTLTEIKEIAESEMDSKEFMAIQFMLNGGIDNKNKVLKQILQKISEVE